MNVEDKNFENYVLECLGDGNNSELESESNEEDPRTDEIDLLRERSADDIDDIITEEEVSTEDSQKADEIDLLREQNADLTDEIISEEEVATEDSQNLDNQEQNSQSFNLNNRREIKWNGAALSSQSREWTPMTEKDSQEIFDPIVYFSRYIPDSFFKIIADMTNIYALQKGERFTDASAQEIRVLLGLHIMMGVLQCPRVELYWDNSLGIIFFTNSMSKNRFFKLRNNLHLVNNLEPRDTNDRLFKVRPIFDLVKNRCKELPLEQKLCVDEQMVPFKGTLSIKQYIRGKPCKWGIKIFMLCGESGICYDFVIYQGKTTEISKSLQDTFDQGAAVVLHLSQRIIENQVPNHQLYFDNYFSSYNLFQALKQNNILATGTARSNRFGVTELKTDKEMAKQERGFMQEVYSEDGDVLFLKWLDNRVVNMASNFVGVGDTDTVRRWDSSKKQYIQVPRPEAIRLYNASMGGVDKIDFLIGIYRIFIRSRKWTLRLIFHAVDLAIVNSWLEYREDARRCQFPKKETLDLMHFRVKLAENLVMFEQASPGRKRGRPSSSHDEANGKAKKRQSESRSQKSIRLDKIDHLPVHSGQKDAGRCKRENCSGKSHFRCEKCKVYLCPSKDRNCFYQFHTK